MTATRKAAPSQRRPIRRPHLLSGRKLHLFSAFRLRLKLLVLYRSPVLGGTPSPIIQDIDTDIAFSPDGKRVAFIRENNPDFGKYRMLIADLVSGEEKTLVSAPLAETFADLSWSPDGKTMVTNQTQDRNVACSQWMPPPAPSPSPAL